MTTLIEIPPSLIKWRASDPVEKREKPIVERTTVAMPAKYEVVKAALDAIKNRDGEELDYDAWRNIIFAVHSATDGDDAGLALAHDFSARSTKYDPDFLDARVWPYVRTDRSDGITVKTLFAAASANGWQDPTVIDDFEVLAPGSIGLNNRDPFTPHGDAAGLGEQSTGATRFKTLTVAEFTTGEPTPWIIKGVLPQAALAVIFGESTSGKTFFALDLIAAVARGEEWRGRRVTQGRGIYICAEGAGGFRNRVRAYLAKHELGDLDMRVIADAPNFTLSDDIKALIASVCACGPVSLIVVDTLARALVGADENSAQDMGKAVYHCEQLHRVTGALVVLIHHSGKDASKGARGSGALRAAADCEIEITRCDNDREAQITKLKDGEDGTAFGFKLQTVNVGVDDDGDSVTSCVVEHTEAAVKGRSKREPKGAVEKAVRSAVLDLMALDGDGLAVSTVIDHVVNQMPFDSAEGKRDKRREHALRAINSLTDRGGLVVNQGCVAVPS